MIQAAKDYFKTHGLPSRKFEAWKHSPIQTFIAPGMLETLPSVEPLAAPLFLALQNQLYLHPVFSLPQAGSSLHPNEIQTTLLSKLAPQEQTELLQQELNYTRHPLAALVQAESKEVALIEIMPGVNTSLHLIHSIPASTPTAIHAWRILIVRAHAELTLFEEVQHATLPQILYNHLTLIHLEEGAKLHYVGLSRKAQTNRTIHGLHVWQQTKSHCKIHTLHVNRGPLRQDIEVHLQGKQAQTVIIGTSIVQSTAHLDQHIRVNHEAAHTHSETDMKSVATDEALSAIHAKVAIPPQSTECGAHQSLHHLLLSKTAKVAVEPQLEIDTDQVQCTHGASVGQLDDAALHYCLSRGIAKKMAERMLTQAFLSHRFSSIPQAILRESFDSLLEEDLQTCFEYAHERND